ncbi:aspartic peptidase domain-containing protein [Naematelia encephala]|uniref:Aspartic peptidase domain-containing protein n=1 Tax=Naematelia encephala TaxID=71784 RepID=A0A1Y2B2I1_9TREE|nr:aspartic peptidase domain-containing protein [Naematelia encephala]
MKRQLRSQAGYLATIQLGTPPADFLMLMDSGSGDTWVPSSDCGLAQCGPHQALGADVSSTFKATQTPFSVTYGSGSVTGALCSDTMSIAGMTLPNHVFGVTTEESQQFAAAQVPFDGLMGLSFSSLSQQNTSTPIESLAAAGLVIQAVMGFALGRVADGENDGEIIFGQPDTSKFDPAMTQVLPVSSESGFWQVAMADVTVNGQSTAQTRQAILDTGTSLMIAPSADAIAFHAQIQGAQASANGMFTIPCTSEAAITMTFGDTAFQIDARDLIFQPVSNDLQGDCISSLSSGTVVDDVTWLLGDTFLKNVYFTTNVEQRTVELSARTDVPGSSGNSTAVRANVEMSDANKARNSMYYVASALASLFLVWH